MAKKRRQYKVTDSSNTGF